MGTTNVLCTVVSGDFNNDFDVVDFLCSLSASELGKRQHHVKEMRIERNGVGRGAVVVLCFAQHADFLVNASINEDGMLSPWQNDLTITKNVQVQMVVPDAEVTTS